MNKFLSKMTNRHWCSLLILFFVLIGLVIGLNTWLPAQPKKIVKAKARTELINMAALESIVAPVDQQASYLALYELGFWDGLLGQKSMKYRAGALWAALCVPSKAMSWSKWLICQLKS
ncbi:hypothetical protein [Deefgea sp. CFH1-16]|uniref:hypothetical protein n=1 Tax=Deefgea sp. CFH1-16 TaxID=2675457 RepID=UPI0015F4BFD7|nr:hypothetical protein [Deefgea sp. CFH1-16]MBM5573536.1 hypothetical protein [Deefgea sp. CFH1-16]